MQCWALLVAEPTRVTVKVSVRLALSNTVPPGGEPPECQESMHGSPGSLQGSCDLPILYPVTGGRPFPTHSHRTPPPSATH
jgi:hypothetical protein